MRVARKALANADMWIAVLVAILNGFFVWKLLSAPGEDTHFRPTTFPLAFAMILVALSLVLFVRSLGRGTDVRELRSALTNEYARTGSGVRVVGTIIATAAYIAALPWVGYLISSMAYFSAMSLMFGNRRLGSILFAMIIVPATLYLFFEKYMLVLLPAGRLFG